MINSSPDTSWEEQRNGTEGVGDAYTHGEVGLYEGS